MKKLMDKDSISKEQLKNSSEYVADEYYLSGLKGNLIDINIAAEELQREKDRAQQYLDIAGVIFVVINAKGEVTLINQKGSEVLGYEQEEILGKNWFDNFLPLNMREEVKAVYSRLMARKLELVKYYENSVLTKNGVARIIAWHNTTLEDDEGNIIGTLSSGEDITERKQAEEDLRKREAHQALVLRSLPMAFYIAQPFGDYGGTWVSDQIGKIAGFTAEQFMHDIHLWGSRLHSDDRRRVLGEFEKIVETDAIEIEYRWQHADGKYLWLLDSGVLIRDENGKPKEIIGTWFDITERKQAEEEKQKLQTRLQQSQKMEAIGTLAGGIAHDFNNILASMIGYTEMSLDEVEKGSLLYNNLQEVFKAGERAKGLVKQILTFSRMGGKELQPVQVMDIAEEALNLLRASIPSTIKIQSNIKSDSVIMAEPAQIHQVLMNLCTNACHAMREKGGTLKFTLEDVEIDLEYAQKYPDIKPGAYMKLTVSDTGCGMSPEVLGRVFEPFFTTKRQSGGSGMGLSVVHGIIKSYGGTITASSQPGKGSTFDVYLPVSETEIEPDAREEKPIPKGTESILFIDDEQAIVDMGKQMLESLGYQVTVKTNSVEALNLFKSQPDRFDLVITDLKMPDLTGDKLAEKVLDIRRDIRVILCTGFGTKLDKEKAESLGIQSFLFKPILKRQMAETVREVLSS